MLNIKLHDNVREEVEMQVIAAMQKQGNVYRKYNCSLYIMCFIKLYKTCLYDIIYIKKKLLKDTH